MIKVIAYLTIGLCIAYMIKEILKAYKIAKEQVDRQNRRKEAISKIDFEMLKNMERISRSELTLSKRTKEEYKEVVNFIDKTISEVENL